MALNQLTTHATSIASWSIAVAKALELYGYNAEDIFKDAGIILSDIESPHSRLPVSCIQKVWQFAYQNTDEYFGVNVSRFLGPASMHALSFGLYTSSTLKELLERLIRYRCVISHMFFAELIEQDNGFLLSIVDERDIKTSITHDALFAYLLTIFREVYSPDFSPLSITLTRNPADSTQKLAEFMRAPLKFGESDSGILFSKEQLEQPLCYGNPVLAVKQDKAVEQYITELGLISEYMLRVKTKIRNLLEDGEVSVSLVAEHLNITVRTLQRRLSDEGSSYNDLLDKIRYELVMDYINLPNATVTDIAFRLGFDDNSSFSRSFKRWTDQSFSHYRRNHSLR